MTTPPRRSSNWILWMASASILGSLLLVTMTATRRRFPPPDPAAVIPDAAAAEVEGADSDRAADNVTTTTTAAPSTENRGRQPPQHKETTATCDRLYDCQTDRIGHESPLCPGQAICSTHRDHQYAFGLSADGVFQWQDCLSGETVVFYNGTAAADASAGGGTTADSSSCDLHFVMAVNASFQIFQQTTTTHNDDSDHDQKRLLLLWQSDCKKHVAFYPQCLAPRPVLDCPYLHLHSGGNVVLNWIDQEGDWQSRNIQRVYPGLFP